MHYLSRRNFLKLGAGAAAAVSLGGLMRPQAAHAASPDHLAALEELINELNAIGWTNGESTYNHYRGTGETDEIIWGTPGDPTSYKCISQCAPTITKALKRVYPAWATNAWFEDTFGSISPSSTLYREGIAAGGNAHFTQAVQVADLQAGDILAIEYPGSTSPSGHVAMVRANLGVYTASRNVSGKTQYLIEIADTTSSVHGNYGDGDTRVVAGGTRYSGVGYGRMCFYANDDGTFYGYRWSVRSSTIYTVEQRPIACARIVP